MKKGLTAFFIALISVVIFSFRSTRDSDKKAVKTVNYTIFGEKYAETPVWDDQLAGHVYYIISGHGGPDPGAVCQVDGKTIAEDEYAYDVSLRLARNLIGHSAKVYMIVRDNNDGIRDDVYLESDTDETVWPDEPIPANQSARLKQRTEVINRLYRENAAKGYKIQRVIETHVDSRYTDHKVDIFFYYNENLRESRMLASGMFELIRQKYEKFQSGRGYQGEVKSRNLWTIQASKPPVVYIELGNITNEFDRKRLMIANNRQAIANWLVEGIRNYSGEQ